MVSIVKNCELRNLKVVVVCSSGIVCIVYVSGLVSIVYLFYGFGIVDLLVKLVLERLMVIVSFVRKI